MEKIKEFFISWYKEVQKRITMTVLWIFTGALLFILIFSVVDSYLLQAEILGRLEAPLVDFRHRLYSSSVSVDEDIVLLAITEDSIEKFNDTLGRFPWPRRVYADIIEHLDRAEKIVFDVGFWDSSDMKLPPGAVDDFLERLRRLESYREARNLDQAGEAIEYLRGRFRELEQPGDNLLVEATDNANNVVHSFLFSHALGYSPPEQEQIEKLSENFAWPAEGNMQFPRRSRLILPMDGLLQNSDELGHISFSSGVDGVIRKFYPFIGLSNDVKLAGEDDGEEDDSEKEEEDEKEKSKEEPPPAEVFPVLGLASALDGPAPVTFENYQLSFEDWTMPVDGRGRANLRFRGNWEDYQVVPVEKILEPSGGNGEEVEYDSEWFADKVVFIGTTADGLGNLKSAPLDSSTPRVGLHAAVYDSIKSRDFLSPESLLETLGLIILLGSMGAAIALLFNFFVGLGLLLVGISGYYYLGVTLFYRGTLINLAQPTIAAVIIYGLLTTYNFILAHQRREFVSEVSRHYLPESVLENVLTDSGKLRLQATQEDLTVLFMDIAGFTTLSEELEATEVAGQLNELLTEMTHCVFRYEGVLDKFIGDKLMAEFGLMEAEPSNPEARSCRAADDMLQRMQQFNENREGDPLNIRIGIHTGEVAAGNMGSEELFDYTVIGDAVNLASRLEGANKYFGSICLLSEGTADRLGREAIIRELDRVVVKGKENPVTVYEWLGWRENVSKDVVDSAWHYEEALSYYRERKWDEAIQQLRKIEREAVDVNEASVEEIAEVEGIGESYAEKIVAYREEHGEFTSVEDLQEVEGIGPSRLEAIYLDEPARRLLERCKKFKENPPPEDWEPITVLENK